MMSNTYQHQIVMPQQSIIYYSDEILNKYIEAFEINIRNLALDFSQVTFIDPFAITFVSGMIHLFHKHKRTVFYKPPINLKVKKYLSQIGFDSHFQLGKQIKGTTSIELMQLTSLNYTYIENLINLIDTNMNLSRGVKDSLKMSIQELLTNVFDHSQSKIGCFACAQYYPNKQLIRLCITDFGVGILATLKNKYNLNTHLDAIALSVEEGITCRKNSAGFGLSLIKKFIEINSGNLSILSGNGKINFSKDRINKNEFKKSFKGTIVNLEINADKDSFYSFTDEEEDIF